MWFSEKDFMKKTVLNISSYRNKSIIVIKIIKICAKKIWCSANLTTVTH